MIPVFLVILKILGIVLLSILAVALLVLFFPITYCGRAEFDSKKVSGIFTAGWLFHFLHVRVYFENRKIGYTLRIVGIPIKSSDRKKGNYRKQKEPEAKEKKSESEVDEKKTVRAKTDAVREHRSPDEKADVACEHRQPDEKTDTLNEHRSPDEKADAVDKRRRANKKNEGADKNNDTRNKSGKRKKFTQRVRDGIEKTKNIVLSWIKKIRKQCGRIKEVCDFFRAETTKEAYEFGKRMVIKLLRHIAPRRVRANIKMGFESPDTTGRAFGMVAMLFAALGINPKHIELCPDFEKKIFEGRANMRGLIVPAIVGTCILRFYFKKEIHDIINSARAAER